MSVEDLVDKLVEDDEGEGAETSNMTLKVRVHEKPEDVAKEEPLDHRGGTIDELLDSAGIESVLVARDTVNDIVVLLIDPKDWDLFKDTFEQNGYEVERTSGDGSFPQVEATDNPELGSEDLDALYEKGNIGALKTYWSKRVGGAEHPFTSMVNWAKKHKDTIKGSPEGWAAWMHKQIFGKTPMQRKASKKEDRTNPPDKIGQKKVLIPSPYDDRKGFYYDEVVARADDDELVAALEGLVQDMLQDGRLSEDDASPIELIGDSKKVVKEATPGEPGDPAAKGWVPYRIIADVEVDPVYLSDDAVVDSYVESILKTRVMNPIDVTSQNMGESVVKEALKGDAKFDLEYVIGHLSAWIRSHPEDKIIPHLLDSLKNVLQFAESRFSEDKTDPRLLVSALRVAVDSLKKGAPLPPGTYMSRPLAIRELENSIRLLMRDLAAATSVAGQVGAPSKGDVVCGKESIEDLTTKLIK